ATATQSTLPPPPALRSGREKVIRGIEQRRREEETRQVRTEFLTSALGDASQFYSDADDFFSKLSRASDSLSIEFVGVDNDGDARFRLGNGETTVDLWLDAECLMDFKEPGVGGRAAALARLLKETVS